MLRLLALSSKRTALRQSPRTASCVSVVGRSSHSASLRPRRYLRTARVHYSTQPAQTASVSSSLDAKTNNQGWEREDYQRKGKTYMLKARQYQQMYDEHSDGTGRVRELAELDQLYQVLTTSLHKDKDTVHMVTREHILLHLADMPVVQAALQLLDQEDIALTGPDQLLVLRAMVKREISSDDSRNEQARRDLETFLLEKVLPATSQVCKAYTIFLPGYLHLSTDKLQAVLELPAMLDRIRQMGQVPDDTLVGKALTAMALHRAPLEVCEDAITQAVTELGLTPKLAAAMAGVYAKHGAQEQMQTLLDTVVEQDLSPLPAQYYEHMLGHLARIGDGTSLSVYLHDWVQQNSEEGKISDHVFASICDGFVARGSVKDIALVMEDMQKLRIAPTAKRFAHICLFLAEHGNPYEALLLHKAIARANPRFHLSRKSELPLLLAYMRLHDAQAVEEVLSAMQGTLSFAHVQVLLRVLQASTHNVLLEDQQRTKDTVLLVVEGILNGSSESVDLGELCDLLLQNLAAVRNLEELFVFYRGMRDSGLLDRVKPYGVMMLAVLRSLEVENSYKPDAVLFDTQVRQYVDELVQDMVEHKVLPDEGIMLDLMLIDRVKRDPDIQIPLVKWVNDAHDRGVQFQSIHLDPFIKKESLGSVFTRMVSKYTNDK